jgi:hypothetical protein
MLRMDQVYVIRHKVLVEGQSPLGLGGDLVVRAQKAGKLQRAQQHTHTLLAHDCTCATSNSS